MDQIILVSERATREAKGYLALQAERISPHLSIYNYKYRKNHLYSGIAREFEDISLTLDAAFYKDKKLVGCSMDVHFTNYPTWLLFKQFKSGIYEEEREIDL